MSKDLTEGLPRSLDENSLPTLEATFTTKFRKAKTDRFRKWSNPQRTGIESIANRLTFQDMGNIFFIILILESHLMFSQSVFVIA